MTGVEKALAWGAALILLIMIIDIIIDDYHDYNVYQAKELAKIEPCG